MHKLNIPTLNVRTSWRGSKSQAAGDIRLQSIKTLHRMNTLTIFFVQCWHSVRKKLCEVTIIAFMLLYKTFVFQSEVQHTHTKWQNIICWYKGNLNPFQKWDRVLYTNKANTKTKCRPSVNIGDLPASWGNAKTNWGAKGRGLRYTSYRQAMGLAGVSILKTIARTMMRLPCIANHAAMINVTLHYLSTHRNFSYHNHCIFTWIHQYPKVTAILSA